MKLLNDIIDLLMTEDSSLNSALLKTKVLLHRIGQADLVEWVNSELIGYTTLESVPNYRRLRGRVVGVVTNGYHIYENHQIPLGQLDDRERNILELQFETSSIHVIEKMIEGVEKGHVYSKPVVQEACVALSDLFTQGYYIQRASATFQISQLQQILVEVRSRLLSFILQLNDKIGESVSDSDAKSAADKIDVPSMFAGAVIGDNATFQILGSHNKQTVSNTNFKGNRQALYKELEQAKVQNADIAELGQAITEDQNFQVTESSYGPKVNSWIGGMINKALSGAWEVKLAVATGVLTNALSKYYGVA